MKVTGEREPEQAGKAFRPRGRSDLHVREVGGGRGGREAKQEDSLQQSSSEKFWLVELYPQ